MLLFSGFGCANDSRGDGLASGLEFVVIAVEHRRDRRHFLGEELQVQLGVAGLDHAAQRAGVGDALVRAVDAAAVAAGLACMAFGAFVLDQQLLAQRQVGVLEDARALGERRDWQRKGQQ